MRVIQGGNNNPPPSDEGLSEHDRVVCEGIAEGIVSWFLSPSPLGDARITNHHPSKGGLDWLLDRLTLELSSRITGFDSKKFVEFVWKECGF